MNDHTEFCVDLLSSTLQAKFVGQRMLPSKVVTKWHYCSNCTDSQNKTCQGKLSVIPTSFYMHLIPKYRTLWVGSADTVSGLGSVLKSMVQKCVHICVHPNGAASNLIKPVCLKSTEKQIFPRVTDSCRNCFREHHCWECCLANPTNVEHYL